MKSLKITTHMQDFYLIRHGETDWNVKLGLLQGHTDIPLNERGILQSKALHKITSELKFNKIISSDLIRARTTAENMTNFQTEIEITSDLREVHLGIGEGLSWAQVEEKLGADFRAKWGATAQPDMNLRFPGGESRGEVLQRIQNCLFKFLRRHPGETLAFVSHGYVIRCLVFHLETMSQDFFVPNCAVVPFAFDGEKLLYKGPDATEDLLQPRL
ncbi:MAG: histidine phosphatase family protein [Pseudobdellovibrionaceae bacterium]